MARSRKLSDLNFENINELSLRYQDELLRSISRIKHGIRLDDISKAVGLGSDDTLELFGFISEARKAINNPKGDYFVYTIRDTPIYVYLDDEHILCLSTRKPVDLSKKGSDVESLFTE